MRSIKRWCWRVILGARALQFLRPKRPRDFVRMGPSLNSELLLPYMLLALSPLRCSRGLEGSEVPPAASTSAVSGTGTGGGVPLRDIALDLFSRRDGDFNQSEELLDQKGDGWMRMYAPAASRREHSWTRFEFWRVSWICFAGGNPLIVHCKAAQAALADRQQQQQQHATH